jgi:hypothetical protein
VIWFGTQFLNFFILAQGRDITLTIHPHLEPILRMIGDTAILPPHAFMAWAGMALPSPSTHFRFCYRMFLVTIFAILDIMYIRLQ